ncbi:TPA: ead/Ea22-like family protein [Enterobacter bugandensis]
MSNIDKQQIRDDIAIRKSMPGFSVSPDHSLARLKAIQETQRSFGLEVVEALLDELEAAKKKTVEMPTFDGYVPHVARELQAAFRTACNNVGINVAAAGKGE